MDRKNFLRTASSFVLLAAGAATGSRAFAETPLSSLMEEITDKCPDPDKQPGLCAKEPITADGIIRLSKIEVYPQYLYFYVIFSLEVGVL